MKILIMMSYYNRPKLVRNALKSILKADENHHDWELAFGDDGSDIPGAPIVEEVMKDHMHKVKLVRNDMTLEEKLDRGLVLGWLANREMALSDADIGIVLCDDDALHPHYLKNLSEFFTNNADVLYCWSSVVLFNPILSDWEKVNEARGKHALWNRYNNHGDNINPVGKVDASQVAWRLDCCKKYGAWFADTTKVTADKPWLRDTDKGFFESLFEKCGPCRRTNFVAQYKAIHDYQLLWHKNKSKEELMVLVREIHEKAGELF